MEIITENALKQALSGHPWADFITVLPEVPSTNTYLRTLAEAGAPQGTVVLAQRQTGGRGRQGRQFDSQPGGVYLSLLLRPEISFEKASLVTPMAAVAVCQGIEALCGIRPGIKWINDLIINEKKFCGILTELDMDPTTGRLRWLILGIGINVLQREFPPELREKATSLAREKDDCPAPTAVAAEVIRNLHRMHLALPEAGADWMEAYKQNCITLGRQVQVIRPGSVRAATALDLTKDGGLVVRYDSGEVETVSSGEVSVRGSQGYL